MLCCVRSAAVCSTSLAHANTRSAGIRQDLQPCRCATTRRGTTSPAAALATLTFAQSGCPRGRRMGSKLSPSFQPASPSLVDTRYSTHPLEGRGAVIKGRRSPQQGLGHCPGMWKWTGIGQGTPAAEQRPSFVHRPSGGFGSHQSGFHGLQSLASGQTARPPGDDGNTAVQLRTSQKDIRIWEFAFGRTRWDAAVRCNVSKMQR